MSCSYCGGNHRTQEHNAIIRLEAGRLGYSEDAADDAVRDLKQLVMVSPSLGFTKEQLFALLRLRKKWIDGGFKQDG